ncbi:cell division protein ZipA C-terminal FtsZ-binding domain-containing protein [Solimonas soli]|uniref:cell division protein ZipA C-terminal FtsZ-binding domain-containing protein n=1 Tax=Solimonas soli TaxID=413479 RepID=UPI0004B3E397|nr:cell division protein ZipA C-terminal FtsZ-binding domain-containing protein [Solimonas soli]
MSALQWALLVLGAAAVIAIYITSRRGEKLPKDWAPPGGGGGPAGRAPKLPGQDQMDMFEARRDSEFDEFGVGKPRKRIEPGFGEGTEPGETAPLFGGAPSSPRQEPSVEAPKKVFEEKIVTLLIAEREGTAIFGAKIHQALGSVGLVYGDRKIYHRPGVSGPIFSVASLIKPGTLDPADQDSLSTPGLTVFMVLPNGAKPREALQDFIATSRALAEQLNAEVFDANRQVFTPEAQRVLVAEVDAWTKRNGL